MANNYLQFSTTLDDLTPEDREWIEAKLADEEYLKTISEEYEDYECLGFDWSIEPEHRSELKEGILRHVPTGTYSLWINSGPEYGSPEPVANFVQDFLKERRPKGCFSMEWACYCSKLRVAEFTGGGVFVTADGQKWVSPSAEINEFYRKHEEEVQNDG